METKRLLLSIAIMMGLMMAWRYSVEFMYRKHPEWLPPSAQAPATQPVVATNQKPDSTTNPTTGPSISSDHIQAAPSVVAKIAALGSTRHADATYAQGILIDPAGASISAVTLNQFFETADHKDIYVFQKPHPDFDAQTRSLATRAVVIDGKTIDLSKVIWNQVSA